MRWKVSVLGDCNGEVSGGGGSVLGYCYGEVSGGGDSVLVYHREALRRAQRATERVVEERRVKIAGTLSRVSILQ